MINTFHLFIALLQSLFLTFFSYHFNVLKSCWVMSILANYFNVNWCLNKMDSNKNNNIYAYSSNTKRTKVNPNTFRKQNRKSFWNIFFLFFRRSTRSRASPSIKLRRRTNEKCKTTKIHINKSKNVQNNFQLQFLAGAVQSLEVK